MDKDKFSLDIQNGDSSRCRTHRVFEQATNAVKNLILENNLRGGGECTPKITSWRPVKLHNNTVVIHRPIRSTQIESNEAVSLAKSAENIAEKYNSPSQNDAHKSLSYCELPKTAANERSVVSRKYCKIGSGRSDKNSVKDNHLTLDSNGFYGSDGSLRLSLTSLSSATSLGDQEERREAFNEWFLRKNKEKLEKSKSENRNNVKPPEKLTEEQRDELFKKWWEKKKSLKEAERMRKKLEKMRFENEKMQQVVGKEDKLKEWAKRKNELLKEAKFREKERADAIALVKEQKRKAGEEAYQLWLQQARNKPLPVPLNKGELSMRGSISSMYINPEPWKCTDGTESSFRSEH